MALCKTLMFLQGVLLSDSSHAFCQQLSLYKKNRPKAICNATAPKTLPQHIPRKLQLKTLLAEVVRYTPLPQHIPRKLQHLTPEEFYAQYEDLCLSTSRANCNYVCSFHRLLLCLCLSTSRANCNGEKHKCFFI